MTRPKGKTITMQVKHFDQKTTARFVKKLRRSLAGWRIDMIWDNALWHKGQAVRDEIRTSRIHEHRLPAYSPQMNACEYYIRWTKETLSYNYCWQSSLALKFALRGFAVSVAGRKDEVLRRCKPQMHGFCVA
ncbi:transposase [Desulfocurvibacter africanus]|uniref:transposase n=1 Tax=Desulfocurvibacter africanus TaxID=873 RepID=UPI002FDAAC9D